MNGAEHRDYVEWLDLLWERRPGDRKDRERTLSLGILLWPAFPLMSLSGIVESLRHAGDFGDRSRQLEGRWEIMGPAGRPVRSSCGLQVTPTSDYLHPGEFDWIFIVGGLLPQLDTAPPQHRRYLRAAHQLGVNLAGFCTGSFVLAEEQLMSRVIACIHPYHRRDYELAFPSHRLVTDRDFSQSGTIATVPGGISALSFMTHLISGHFGPDRAAKVAHQLSLPERCGIGLFDQASIRPHLDVADPRIQKAIVMMDAGVSRRLSIPDLARQTGMSERHFSRLFTSTVGTSPRDYLVRLRLRAAVWMLRHSAKSITTIAHDTGFFSSAHLATACTKKIGKTPSQIRSDGARGGC